MKRASSLRGTEWPTPRTSVALISAPLLHRRARALHGLDDVLIPGAAADLAGDRGTDVLLRRARVLGEQRHRRQHHPRRAEAALKAVLRAEGLLDRVQRAALHQSLDRGDPAAVGLDREHRA